MPKNKVKFNLKNVHYALLTLSAQNVPSYGKPCLSLVRYLFRWTQMENPKTSMRTVLSITSSTTIWAMTATWSWP